MRDTSRWSHPRVSFSTDSRMRASFCSLAPRWRYTSCEARARTTVAREIRPPR